MSNSYSPTCVLYLTTRLFFFNYRDCLILRGTSAFLKDFPAIFMTSRTRLAQHLPCLLRRSKCSFLEFFLRRFELPCCSTSRLSEQILFFFQHDLITYYSMPFYWIHFIIFFRFSHQPFYVIIPYDLDYLRFIIVTS